MSASTETDTVTGRTSSNTWHFTFDLRTTASALAIIDSEFRRNSLGKARIVSFSTDSTVLTRGNDVSQLSLVSESLCDRGYVAIHGYISGDQMRLATVQNWLRHTDIRNLEVTRIRDRFNAPLIIRFLDDSALPAAGESAGGRRLRVDTVNPSGAPRERRGAPRRNVQVECEVGVGSAPMPAVRPPPLSPPPPPPPPPLPPAATDPVAGGAASGGGGAGADSSARLGDGEAGAGGPPAAADGGENAAPPPATTDPGPKAGGAVYGGGGGAGADSSATEPRPGDSDGEAGGPPAAADGGVDDSDTLDTSGWEPMSPKTYQEHYKYHLRMARRERAGKDPDADSTDDDSEAPGLGGAGGTGVEAGAWTRCCGGSS